MTRRLAVTLLMLATLVAVGACSRTDPLRPSGPGAKGYTVSFRIETGDVNGHPVARSVELLSVAVQSDQQIALRRPADDAERALADWAEISPGNFELVPPGTGTHVRRPLNRAVMTPWVHTADLGNGVVSVSINAILFGEPGESVTCSAYVGGVYVDDSIRTAQISQNARAAEVTCLHIY